MSPFGASIHVIARPRRFPLRKLSCQPFLKP